MQIKEAKVEPVKDSIEPALKFNIILEYAKLTEAPLSAEGSLLAEDGKVLTHIGASLASIDPSKVVELGVRQIQQKQVTTAISFIVPLSNKALDHIESVRDKNPYKDVVLHLKFKIKFLRTTAVLSSIREIDEIGLPSFVTPEARSKIQKTYRNAVPICSLYDPKYTPSRTTMWVISGDGGPVFLTLNEQEVSTLVKIPSSYWMRDFAPYLGLGRYFVVEIPEPKLANLAGGSEFATRVNKAIQALTKIQKRIKEGEWNEVMEDAREVHELLRHHALIKDTLKRDGYTDEAAEYLLNSIKSIFNLSSKFIHRVDQTGKKILPEIKASKEDAYLVYVTTAGLVNLLARKVKAYGQGK